MTQFSLVSPLYSEGIHVIKLVFLLVVCLLLRVGGVSTKNPGQSENCFSSHTYAMEYYSTAERNEPSTYGKTWINPQYILLSESVQSEEAAHSMTPLMTFWERQSYISNKQITSLV